MTDNTYNGWTNYATWRVNLEIFDGMSAEIIHHITPEALREYAEDLIESTTLSQGLALDYALAFLADVNWHEIAEHIKEND